MAPAKDYLDRITRKRVAGVETTDIYAGSIPFVLMQIIMVVALIAFPGLVTFTLDKKMEVDLDTIEIKVEGGGSDGGGWGAQQSDSWVAVRHPGRNKRQEDHIELIASEKLQSGGDEAQGPAHQQVRRGLPGKRYYGGCEHVDIAEQAGHRPRQEGLFGAEAANVQPHSGSQANQAVLMAFCQTRRHHHGHEPGRRRPPDPRHAAEHVRQVVQRRRLRPLDAKEEIDYDKMEAWRASTNRRSSSPAPRPTAAHRLERFAKDRQGSRRHLHGRHGALRRLIAAGFYPNPVPHADVVTSTTHKTLRGPRGGIILMKAEHEEGHQLGHLPRPAGRPADARHRRQGGGLRSRRRPEFRNYQEQVIANARVMAACCPEERGLRIVSGAPKPRLPGRPARQEHHRQGRRGGAGRAHITVNKNAIPNDPRKPFTSSGIRIGSPAMTTRGFTEIEAEKIAHLIADVLDARNDERSSRRCAARSPSCAKFPVYGARSAGCGAPQWHPPRPAPPSAPHEMPLLR